VTAHAHAVGAIAAAAAAEVIGLGHRKGRIAPGFDADILAVDGDPIADPGALHRIQAIWARGTAVPDAGSRPGGTPTVSPRPAAR
jgi:imidazolonepropionase-like amidohydrolase